MAKQPEVWNPLREMERFRENVDDLFDRFLGRPAAATAAAHGPALESFVEDDKLVVRVDLPGIDPEQVEVTVSGNVLTIKGRREERREDTQRDFIHREIGYGSFERSLPLPRGVKTEAIAAAYRNGVLELIIPMPKETTPRKVAVEIEGQRAPAGAQKPKPRK
ncbi:MAG TPA: Hsp20/alpha crystallin family protein [Candidatus Binataceae bacterium]|nr:Hsp20/alpha crystallin family protein [Candidatus Binataceae bacterium]